MALDGVAPLFGGDLERVVREWALHEEETVLSLDRARVVAVLLA